MRLRSFHPEDLRKLNEIDQACFAPGISYSPGEMARFTGHRFSQTWVAEEAGEIVGFLIAKREPRGVGSVLMDAAEQWAREQELALIGLETAQDNLAAQRFYAARGYRKVDNVENYYADGTAAWIMVKSL
jgi:hypothetical protein